MLFYPNFNFPSLFLQTHYKQWFKKKNTTLTISIVLSLSNYKFKLLRGHVIFDQWVYTTVWY